MFRDSKSSFYDKLFQIERMSEKCLMFKNRSVIYPEQMKEGQSFSFRDKASKPEVLELHTTKIQPF